LTGALKRAIIVSLCMQITSRFVNENRVLGEIKVWLSASVTYNSISVSC
jgi:hypothetical protein